MPAQSQLKQVVPAKGCGQAHHWRIESPSGGTLSRGICKNCGASKDFRNGEPERGNYQQRNEDEKKLRFSGRGLVGRVIA